MEMRLSTSLAVETAESMRLDVIAVGVEGTQLSSRLRSESWRESNSIYSKRADATNWPNPLTGQPYKAETPELSNLSLRGPAPGSLRGTNSDNCNLRNIHVVTKIVV